MKKEVKIRLHIAYPHDKLFDKPMYLKFLHGQYFWIGMEGGVLGSSAPNTSAKRFLKAALKQCK